MFIMFTIESLSFTEVFGANIFASTILVGVVLHCFHPGFHHPLPSNIQTKDRPGRWIAVLPFRGFTTITPHPPLHFPNLSCNGGISWLALKGIWKKLLDGIKIYRKRSNQLDHRLGCSEESVVVGNEMKECRVELQDWRTRLLQAPCAPDCRHQHHQANYPWTAMGGLVGNGTSITGALLLWQQWVWCAYFGGLKKYINIHTKESG